MHKAAIPPSETIQFRERKNWRLLFSKCFFQTHRPLRKLLSPFGNPHVRITKNIPFHPLKTIARNCGTRVRLLVIDIFGKIPLKAIGKSRMGDFAYTNFGTSAGRGHSPLIFPSRWNKLRWAQIKCDRISPCRKTKSIGAPRNPQYFKVLYVLAIPVRNPTRS